MSDQRWSPEQYARNARFVSELGAPVLELLAPQPGEWVLDLGCGDGALTRRLVDAGCVVTAIDASAEQVEAARARGLDAHIAHAERLPFADQFDAVFSNAVLHWVRDHDAMLAGVRRALVPGGRFVGEFGGAGNVARIRRALGDALARRGADPVAIDPWYFPDAEEYAGRLLVAGFAVDSAQLLSRPTPLPGDIAEWLETLAQPFLAALPRIERDGLIDEVRTALRPRLYDEERGWVADYVRLRFAARKPPP